VFGEYTPDHIFIDVGAERSIELLCDPWAPKPGISAFHSLPAMESEAKAGSPG